jgi:PAS domain S-box-containing protein
MGVHGADSAGRESELASGLVEAERREFELASWLAAIVDSPVAIIGITRDHVVTRWNAAAERMYGYAADEIIGRSGSLLWTPEGTAEAGLVLERVRRGERVEQFETRLRRQDGSLVDASCSVSPVRDASGGMIGAAVLTWDVSERKRLEADRHALQHRLEQSERFESLGQLAGGVAHDFNNLLAAILNYAGFVAEESADRPAVRADAEQIQAVAQRAARLTRQLLIFSRREAVQPVALDLSAVVADVRNLLSRSIGTHIELRVESAAGLPAIEADRGQLEQVLLNLAINARDAMPEGGILTIGTRVVDFGEGSTGLNPHLGPGRYAELAVADTGTGMSPEVAERIFEPFFTTKPRDQGTGLGLATVYGIVTGAGGAMSVESEEGAGATFRLYFPAVRGSASGAAAVAAAPDGQGNGETILIVDDEPSVLEVAARILRGDGYAILEAGTYEEALSLAASGDFQLLLTDSIMPGMSGISLAERLGELRPGLPVLYMSGYSEDGPGGQRVAEGAAAFVAKPFSRRTLLEKVHAALKTPAARNAGTVIR